MSNPIHPTRTVTLGGVEFPLRYEYRDFAKAEGRTGIALIGPSGQKFWGCGMAAYMTGVLLFVGLLNSEKRVCAKFDLPYPLQLDDVFGLIDFDNSKEIDPVVTDAVVEVFARMTPKLPEPEPQPEAEQATPLAPSSTGTTSGPSPSSTSE